MFDFMKDSAYQGCEFLHKNEFDIFTCKAEVWWILITEQYGIWIYSALGFIIAFGVIQALKSK